MISFKVLRLSADSAALLYHGKWTHPKMILDDYELVIVLKGRFQMRIGQARKEFLEGDCFMGALVLLYTD